VIACRPRMTDTSHAMQSRNSIPKTIIEPVVPSIPAIVPDSRAIPPALPTRSLAWCAPLAMSRAIEMTTPPTMAMLKAVEIAEKGFLARRTKAFQYRFKKY
jgi:hypothetical protein